MPHPGQERQAPEKPSHHLAGCSGLATAPAGETCPFKGSPSEVAHIRSLDQVSLALKPNHPEHCRLWESGFESDPCSVQTQSLKKKRLHCATVPREQQSCDQDPRLCYNVTLTLGQHHYPIIQRRTEGSTHQPSLQRAAVTKGEGALGAEEGMERVKSSAVRRVSFHILYLYPDTYSLFI